MATYTHNRWQKAAFWCWGAGGAVILLPIIVAVLLPERYAPVAYGVVFFGCILGIIALATGGTLHQIGMGRERQD